jgi:hypothetical protein
MRREKTTKEQPEVKFINIDLQQIYSSTSNFLHEPGGNMEQYLFISKKSKVRYKNDEAFESIKFILELDEITKRKPRVRLKHAVLSREVIKYPDKIKAKMKAFAPYKVSGGISNEDCFIHTMLNRNSKLITNEFEGNLMEKVRRTNNDISSSIRMPNKGKARSAFLLTSAVLPSTRFRPRTTTARKYRSHLIESFITQPTRFRRNINPKGSGVVNQNQDGDNTILIDPNKTIFKYYKAPRGVSNDESSGRINLITKRWRTKLKRSNSYEISRKRRGNLNDIYGTIENASQGNRTSGFIITSARLQSTHTCPATIARKYTNHSHDYPLINLTYLSNSINSQEKPIGSEVQNLPGYSPKLINPTE